MAKGHFEFPVVAIGASAGGLDALTSFLNALRPDLGPAYVIVPHLDPSRESSFAQILSRLTRMSVVQVEDGMDLEANHVYVIPPNCDMTILDGKLKLSDRPPRHGANPTIDTFMRSLASDQGSNAIGIILSGTGSDGTQGMIAIKGEGGITFAQDSQTAKYDGMPMSAVAAECVDFVLPPDGIADELARLRHHPYLKQSAGEEEKDGDSVAPDQIPDHVDEVFRLLQQSTGVDFSEYKRGTIRRRIQRRMALHRIEKVADYVSVLRTSRDEIRLLHGDLLINVTSFFRDPKAFEALKQVVYPAILESRGKATRPVRIWVPGCSTGEECYSHAIMLLEYLGEQGADIPIQIFGTDLSSAAIESARVGSYRDNIVADVSPARLRRFFHETDGGYQISKTIRDLCIFSTQNVANDPPFSKLDLVSCRNVMIYLSQSLQRRVIPVFHYALNAGGMLMIGSTEGLVGSGSELFEIIDRKHKIYRRKSVATPAILRFSMRQFGDGYMKNLPEDVPVKSPETLKATSGLQREADRMLLSQYAPPAVVVSDALEVLQTRGHTGDFLELPVGKATLNILKLAKPGLLFELQSALDEARAGNVEVLRKKAQFENRGVVREITIRVLPLRVPGDERTSFLIVFDEPATKTGGQVDQKDQIAQPTTATIDRQIAHLKQELAATREYLQSIIEAQELTNAELQSANEEIQSGNEELQSANEELQTSKEELESANEELHTVNDEMQHRNELLTQLNNDFSNLLNSVDMALVIVGSDLSIRRITPQAGAVLGLVPSDVGRPIPRLKLKIDVGNLEEMLLEVMRSAQAKQYRVQEVGGSWYAFRMTPYKTTDNRIEGVVLNVVAEESNGAGSKNGQGKTRKSGTAPKGTRQTKK